MLNFIDHINGIVSNPSETATDVKRQGWSTPFLSLMATLVMWASIPVPDPAERLLLLKAWLIYKLSQILAMWAAGLTQGGRAGFWDAVKVGSWLTLLDGALIFMLTRSPFLMLVQVLLPVIYYLAIKGMHEYENDALAFRVTLSAFMLFLLFFSLLGRIIEPGAASLLLMR